MAGFYADSYSFDSCYQKNQEVIDNGRDNYMLDYMQAMPPGINKAFLNARGSTPSFWGPANGPVVNRDSYMSGRAQPLSKCPEYDVIRNYGQDLTSNALLPPKNGFSQTGCFNSDLEPAFDHTLRSCQSVTETDISSYTLFPGVYQTGYTSFDTLANIFTQTRLPMDLGVPCNGKSYGSYDPTYTWV